MDIGQHDDNPRIARCFHRKMLSSLTMKIGVALYVRYLLCIKYLNIYLKLENNGDKYVHFVHRAYVI